MSVQGADLVRVEVDSRALFFASGTRVRKVYRETEGQVSVFSNERARGARCCSVDVLSHGFEPFLAYGSGRRRRSRRERVALVARFFDNMPCELCWAPSDGSGSWPIAQIRGSHSVHVQPHETPL